MERHHTVLIYSAGKLGQNCKMMEEGSFVGGDKSAVTDLMRIVIGVNAVAKRTRRRHKGTQRDP
jgi:hypothetical protein